MHLLAAALHKQQGVLDRYRLYPRRTLGGLLAHNDIAGGNSSTIRTLNLPFSTHSPYKQGVSGLTEPLNDVHLVGSNRERYRVIVISAWSEVLVIIHLRYPDRLRSVGCPGKTQTLLKECNAARIPTLCRESSLPPSRDSGRTAQGGHHSSCNMSCIRKAGNLGIPSRSICYTEKRTHVISGKYSNRSCERDTPRCC